MNLYFSFNAHSNEIPGQYFLCKPMTDIWIFSYFHIKIKFEQSGFRLVSSTPSPCLVPNSVDSVDDNEKPVEIIANAGEEVR